MTKDLFLNTIIPLRHAIEEALGKKNTSFYFDPSTSFVFARVIDRKIKTFYYKWSSLGYSFQKSLECHWIGLNTPTVGQKLNYAFGKLL